jgi:hypothetical protein
MESIKLKTNTFNCKHIRFQENRDDKKVLKSVYVNYNSNGNDKRILYQTPRMRCPFGLSGYSYEGQPPKYTIQASFDDSDDAHKQMKKQIEKLDKLIVETATKEKWMKGPKDKKSPSAEVVLSMYKSYITDADKEKGYPASFKVAVSQNKKVIVDEVTGKKVEEFIPDSFRMGVYDTDKNKITSNFEEVINPKCYAELLLKCNIWVGPKQFGCKWIVEQVKVEKSTEKQGYGFIDSEDEADEADEADDADDADGATQAIVVNDSDEEEVEDEDE